jgi:CoA:oxalate CoA-transferase
MSFSLQGIRVLDLTRVLAGPYATMILGDLGADIYKIEIPGKGDDSRTYGPYLGDESAYFLSLNRNKRSMTLNLKADKGKQVFLEMVPQVDVVVENFRPGTMEKLGLGYEALSLVNPGLIYAAVSGFGHSGPYSDRAAYDAIVQAMGGIMSITGPEGGPPSRVGSSIGDITAGMFTTIGILSALIHRQRTGEGQKVDVAMLDSQVAILENAIARYQVNGEIPEPLGTRHPSIVPFETFETADGQLMVAAGNDALWCKLCAALEQPELAGDARFITNSLRVQHYAVLRPLLAEHFKVKNSACWRDILDTAGIPNSPVNTIDKVLEHPQVLARQMITEIEHPTAGNVKMPGIPVKLSHTPGEIRLPAPLLGQHTQEILAELLSYSSEQVATLRNEGVV